jgi:tetraacyldisaccharide 4'-kinase
VIEHAFPDHHRHAARELAFAGTAPILMTEKDAVKCRAFADPRLWSVPAELELAAPAATRLNAVFAMLPPPKSPVRAPEPRQAQSP